MSTDDEPINLLSFDGGGVRGVTSLLILHKLMVTIKEQHGLAEIPKPCEFFHMMAGTSTGGLIAIMLGRLRMSTEEALLEYDRCAGKIFSSKKLSNMSEKFPSTPLRETIQDLVKRRGMGELMKDPTNPSKGKAVVCVMPANQVAAPRLVRTFRNADEWDKDIKIWEAARATTAASTYFKPQSLESGGTTELYIDAAIGINNPSSYLLQEAAKEFGSDRKFGCLISIGTGTRRVQVGRARSGFRTVIEAPKVVLGVLNVVKNTATDGEEAHRQVAGRFKKCKGSYFRFNVEDAAAAAKLHHYDKMGVLKSMTEKYLTKPTVVGALDEVANLLEHSGYEHGLTIGHIAHLDPTQIVRTSTKARFRSEPSQFFTGREDILDRLDRFFTKRDTGGKPRRQFLLYGIGGAGKTQIALKFADLVEERCKVYYIDGTDVVTITQSYARIATEEGWGSGGSEQLKLLALKHLAQDSEEWLLIFDNCSKRDRQEYIPRTNRGNILYTSRDHDLMLEFPDSCVYKVTEMKEEDASKLLLSAAGERYDPINATHKARAQEIVNELGGLPLAIDQAAAYIRAGVCTLDQYLDRFRTERSQWLSNPKFCGASRHDQAVYTTFEASYQAILAVKRREGKSKAGLAANMAVKALSFVCFLHNEGISVQTPWRALRQWRLLLEHDNQVLNGVLETLSGSPDISLGQFFMTHEETGSDESPYFEGLLMLQKFSLVDLSRDRGFASMHVLVHSWGRDRMDDAARVRHAHMARLIVIESLMENPDIVDDMYLRLAVPHVRACLRYAPSELPLENPAYEAHLLSNLANLLRLDRRYEEARVYLEKSIRVNKLHAHGNTIAVIRDLESLARIHHEKGDLGAAEAVALEAQHRLMCIWKEKLQFGEIQKEAERREEKTQSLSTNEAPVVAATPDESQVADLSNRTTLDLDNSEPPSLKTHYENFSTEDCIEWELSYIGELLGAIYYDQGDLQQMGPHLNRSLEIKERLMPPNDIELWWSQDQAARRTSLLRDAKYWAERFLEVQRLKQEYKMEAEYINHAHLRELAQIFADSLVRTRQFTNRFSDELYEIALGQYQKIINAHAAFYNTTDRRILEMKRMMTVCLVKMGDGGEAEKTARNCLELARGDYGDWHLETILSLEELHNALVCKRGGCDREGLHVIEQSLLRARVALGMDHRITQRIERRVDWALDNLQPHLSDWYLAADDELSQIRSRVDEVYDIDELRTELFGPADNHSERKLRALEEAKKNLKKPSKRKRKANSQPHSVPVAQNAAPAGRVRPPAVKLPAPEEIKEPQHKTLNGQSERFASTDLSQADEETMVLLRRCMDQQSESSGQERKQNNAKPTFPYLKAKYRKTTHLKSRSNRLPLFSFRKKETRTNSIEMIGLNTAQAAG
ncbi:putative calcium-independent phospholipase A2-gamma [Triangularia setosa]|uniref:Calcium-independent phospholipase A2-gamma n=1 Tax=Triangularia setosa TaxID=2587417 RepID=A0AAN7ADF3_9PEZI|nr:putative calcium-independent phospholipase A2-gamma [Podospora setosa]